MAAHSTGTFSLDMALSRLTPSPTVSPNHSPTMAPISARVEASRRATKICGSAAGRRSFQKSWGPVAPKLRRTATWSGLTVERPASVFTVTGKKVS